MDKGKLGALPRESLEAVVEAAVNGASQSELLDMISTVPPHLDTSMPLSVVIFGATGDLAKKKLFPALYQLVLLGHFPR